jgi:hypothetical protein
MTHEKFNGGNYFLVYYSGMMDSIRFGFVTYIFSIVGGLGGGTSYCTHVANAVQNKIDLYRQINYLEYLKNKIN